MEKQMRKSTQSAQPNSNGLAPTPPLPPDLPGIDLTDALSGN